MFYHLHLHTVYSVLDGMCKIEDLIQVARNNNINALAITDHGTMFGCAKLYDLCSSSGIKPIFGCEMYVARRSAVYKSISEDKSGNHLILLAKNDTGYKNLCKLNSLSYKVENFYYKPRIDFDMLKNYHEGLICLSACIIGIVPEHILDIVLHNNDLLSKLIDDSLLKMSIKDAVANLQGRLKPHMALFEDVRKIISEYQLLFGDDYYIELQRHGNENGITQLYDQHNELSILVKEIIVNSVLLNMDLNNYVATNDVHFINKEDAHSHDIQLCISTKKSINSQDKLSYTGEEYFKTEGEMSDLFNEKELAVTCEIVNKIESISPTHKAQMPRFKIPLGFKDEAEYLKNLVFSGATDLYIKQDTSPLTTFLQQTENMEVSTTLSVVDSFHNSPTPIIDMDRVISESFYVPHTIHGYFYSYGLLYQTVSIYETCLYCSSVLDLALYLSYIKDFTQKDISMQKSFLKKFVLYPYSMGIRNFCLHLIERLLPLDAKKRIEYELNIILEMGFPGYFLIMWDLIRACREELQILVGPGRGSAAGSIIAYCLYITRLDPLEYNLLFERFLNPDRISLPDIDTDFEFTSRNKAIEYATLMYGENNVSHIITFSNLLPRSTIADVARVYDQPISLSNTLKSLIPNNLDNFKNEKGNTPTLTIQNCCKYVQPLKNLLQDGDAKDDKYSQLSSNKYTQLILKDSINIEGIIRGVGVHACGIIIGKSDLSNFVPMATVEDKEYGRIAVTQYDGHYIENMGLIKMDFLGLKNLTIIQKCIDEVNGSNSGVHLDFYNLPIDDKETYEIFQKGDTIGIFQFESEGMQTYLKKLQPTEFNDLIAMNALYRPGPMAYIPQYIERKHGASVFYKLPCMEKYLADTYGITIYQEQVMLLSREIAGFTRGESDTLRKAMGKKKKDLLDGLYNKFIAGGLKNGYEKKILDDIWKDWLSFASYAFNKSHAACYAYVAYATAYLKAHYRAMFLSACLSVFGSDRKEISKFTKDAKSSGVKIILPDINLAQMDFTAYNEDKKQYILFGFGGLKGLGEGIIDKIIAEREKNGMYKDIYDFASRMDAYACGKKTFEILTYAGAFDSFGNNRNAYLGKTTNNEDFFDTLIRWSGKNKKKNTSASSLFGKEDKNLIQHPEMSKFTTLSSYEILKMEKEYVGMFVSENPLDNYLFELKYLCNFSVEDLIYFDTIKNAVDRKNTEEVTSDDNNISEEDGIEETAYDNVNANEWIEKYQNATLNFAGIVTDIQECISKNRNTHYKKITIEGYEDTFTFPLFEDQYNSVQPQVLIKDAYIYITAIIQQKNKDKQWFKEKATNEADFELKLINVQPLSDIQESLVDSISIYIDANAITQNFINQLYAVTNTGDTGTTTLKIQIIDDQNSIFLTNNRSKIRITTGLYDFIQQNNLGVYLSYKKLVG